MQLHFAGKSLKGYPGQHTAQMMRSVTEFPGYKRDFHWELYCGRASVVVSRTPWPACRLQVTSCCLAKGDGHPSGSLRTLLSGWSAALHCADETNYMDCSASPALRGTADILGVWSYG